MSSSEQRYRDTMGNLTPSLAWRESTLAAMQAAHGRKARLRHRPMVFAAGAAALALAVAGGLWWQSRSSPSDPGTARTPRPVLSPSPGQEEQVPAATPQPLTGQGESFLLVADLAQQLGSNPTAGHTYELSELPVYANPVPTQQEQRAELLGWAEQLGYTIESPDDVTWQSGFGEDTMGREPRMEAVCTDGTQLRLTGLNTLTIYHAPDLPAVAETVKDILLRDGAAAGAAPAEAAEEILTTYNFDGSQEVTQATFLSTPGASVADQLYSYSFWRMELTQTQLTICLPPVDAGTAYPLRSPDDAQAAFRAGDYWGGCSTAHPDQAQILFVCLEYDRAPGQPYIQPVYRILYTQSYWDELVADWVFDGVDPSPYMGLGVAYVPAIDPEYQDEVPYRRYFNDDLAHHTPEDLAQ